MSEFSCLLFFRVSHRTIQYVVFCVSLFFFLIETIFQLERNSYDLHTVSVLYPDLHGNSIKKNSVYTGCENMDCAPNFSKMDSFLNPSSYFCGFSAALALLLCSSFPPAVAS